MSAAALPNRPAGPWREAHAHLMLLGEALSLTELDRCASVAQCLDFIRQAAAKARAAGPGAWARLTGARVEAWAEARWPTRAEIDDAAGDVPCAVMSFDYHHVAAGTAALRAAGILDQPAELAPLIDRDARGELTGLVREEAAYRVWRAAPEPAPAQRRGMILAALDHLSAMGCVEVHDLHSQTWLPDVLADLDRAGQLRLNVRLYPAARDLAAMHARRAAFEGPRLRLAGGKIFADGTLNGRTASMIHRYALPIPDHPRGHCMVSPAAMDEAVRLADGLGLHLAVHAIGDGAVRMVLDSIERVRPRSRGWRIEHAEIVDAMDVPRFKALGVTCSVQPCHLLADIETLSKYLPHRLPRVLPLRELIDSGLKLGSIGDDASGAEPGLVFGSDVPVVRANPEDSLQAAVFRRRPGEPESEMIAPKQAITLDEAWACFAPSRS